MISPMIDWEAYSHNVKEATSRKRLPSIELRDVRRVLGRTPQEKGLRSAVRGSLRLALGDRVEDSVAPELRLRRQALRQRFHRAAPVLAAKVQVLLGLKQVR